MGDTVQFSIRLQVAVANELLELPPLPPPAIEVTEGFITVTVTPEVADISNEEKMKQHAVAW